MILLLTAISGAAAWRFEGTWVFWPAVVNTLLVFWSGGVLSETAGAPVSGVPEQVAVTISMICSLAGIILLVVSFFAL